MIPDIFFTRVRLLFLAIFLFGLLLISRLAFVQILEGNEWSRAADKQYVSPAKDSFKRGTVFFQYKDGALSQAATLKSEFILAVNPEALSHPRGVFKELKKIIPALDEELFLKKALKKGDPYEEIARRLPKEIADAIRARNIPGVYVYEEQWRYYPGESLSAHVLGFVGFEDDELSGQYGVERYYNDILKREGKELSVNFFAEIFANIEHSLFYETLVSREGDLVLSIEPEVSRFLSTTLDAALGKWHTDEGGGIVMNPITGAVYAMEARPVFDPNVFGESTDYAVFTNPFVESVFEVGSILKPLTIAFGLDTGAVTGKSAYYDAGAITVGDVEILNYDGKARGLIPIQEILNQSLNVGAVYVMQKTGKKAFARYVSEFGLGEETGIDLPNEVSGLTSNLETNRDVEFATAAFGQGIALTPIAVARALSALANGGMLVTPHVAQRIDYAVGSSKVVSYGDEKRVIKKETSEEITRMLVQTVDTALLRGQMRLPRFSIAAKTGTAQLLNPRGGYYEDKYLHSFFGYFPAYNPQFLVFLYIVNPRGVYFASETLTYPFFDIAKFLLSYYEVPPDR